MPGGGFISKYNVGKVRGSAKSCGFVLWARWIYVQTLWQSMYELFQYFNLIQNGGPNKWLSISPTKPHRCHGQKIEYIKTQLSARPPLQVSEKINVFFFFNLGELDTRTHSRTASCGISLCRSACSLKTSIIQTFKNVLPSRKYCNFGYKEIMLLCYIIMSVAMKGDIVLRNDAPQGEHI